MNRALNCIIDGTVFVLGRLREGSTWAAFGVVLTGAHLLPTPVMYYVIFVGCMAAVLKDKVSPP